MRGNLLGAFWESVGVSPLWSLAAGWSCRGCAGPKPAIDPFACKSMINWVAANDLLWGDMSKVKLQGPQRRT